MIEMKNAKSLGELSRGNAVEHPDHYAGDGQIECMDAMRSMMSGDQYALPAQSAYWWGCAFGARTAFRTCRSASSASTT